MTFVQPLPLHEFLDQVHVREEWKRVEELLLTEVEVPHNSPFEAAAEYRHKWRYIDAKKTLRAYIQAQRSAFNKEAFITCCRTDGYSRARYGYSRARYDFRVPDECRRYIEMLRFPGFESFRDTDTDATMALRAYVAFEKEACITCACACKDKQWEHRGKVKPLCLRANIQKKRPAFEPQPEMKAFHVWCHSLLFRKALCDLFDSDPFEARLIEICSEIVNNPPSLRNDCARALCSRLEQHLPAYVIEHHSVKTIIQAALDGIVPMMDVDGKRVASSSLISAGFAPAMRRLAYETVIQRQIVNALSLVVSHDVLLVLVGALGAVGVAATAVYASGAGFSLGPAGIAAGAAVGVVGGSVAYTTRQVAFSPEELARSTIRATIRHLLATSTMRDVTDAFELAMSRVHSAHAADVAAATAAASGAVSAAAGPSANAVAALYDPETSENVVPDRVRLRRNLLWVDANVNGQENTRHRQFWLKRYPKLIAVDSVAAAVTALDADMLTSFTVVTSGALLEALLQSVTRTNGCGTRTRRLGVRHIFVFCADRKRHLATATRYTGMVDEVFDQFSGVDDALQADRDVVSTFLARSEFELRIMEAQAMAQNPDVHAFATRLTAEDAIDEFIRLRQSARVIGESRSPLAETAAAALRTRLLQLFSDDVVNPTQAQAQRIVRVYTEELPAVFYHIVNYKLRQADKNEQLLLIGSLAGKLIRAMHVVGQHQAAQAVVASKYLMYGKGKVLFRGMNVNDQVFQQFARASISSVVFFREFISTTTEKATALGFANGGKFENNRILVEIDMSEAPDEVNGPFGAIDWCHPVLLDTNELSAFPTETEVLWPPQVRRSPGHAQHTCAHMHARTYVSVQIRLTYAALTLCRSLLRLSTSWLIKGDGGLRDFGLRGGGLYSRSKCGRGGTRPSSTMWCFATCCEAFCPPRFHAAVSSCLYTYNMI